MVHNKCGRLVQFTTSIQDPLVKFPKPKKSSKKEKKALKDSGTLTPPVERRELSLWHVPNNVHTRPAIELMELITNEVWYKIFKLLDAKTVSNISVVCHRYAL